MKIQLIEHKNITGDLVILTGLHIGAGSDTIEIGGMDNPIVKDPYTSEPYIPGSSLKGKIRSLLEWREGKISSKGDPCKCGDPECLVCRIFGVSADRERKTGPTRLIVRDARISRGFLSEMQQHKFFPDEKSIESEGFSPEAMTRRRAIASYLVEIKSENAINRVTAVPNPRSLERVPAGTVFDLQMTYRVFSVEDDGGKRDLELLAKVKEGIRALENDALGGYGSRGCGRVKIDNLQLDGEPWD